MFDGIGSEAQAQRALEEIERLVRDAAAAGLRLDPWLGEVADELRAAWPEIDLDGAAELARRVAAKPLVSIAAQSRVHAATVRALKS